MHGGCPRLPPGLEWATRDAGLLTPDGLGSEEDQTFLPCQGGWQGSRCPDRNLNRYAGTRPVHQAASVTQVRQRKETSPQAAPPPRSVRSSSQWISSSAIQRRFAVWRGLRARICWSLTPAGDAASGTDPIRADEWLTG
jgi:hypothetical protein